jgi:hypothetical protein
MKNRALLIALIVVSVFCTSFAYQAQNKPTSEYKFEYAPSEKKVNELASQGWELVAIQSPSGGAVGNVSTFVFKRVKS